jgi:6-pyruvoyltetrahydropterin/6-carboxytetrahydropterin synthase
MKKYQSTKLFDNYSVAIRQHRAIHSHCQLLHGYSFEFKVWFESIDGIDEEQLDEMNWIVDYGIFSRNGLKDWMNSMFDHTMIIEKDDPFFDLFEQMGTMGIAKPIFVKRIGAESMAKLVFDKFNDVFSKTEGGRVKVVAVECFENNKNSSVYYEDGKPHLFITTDRIPEGGC